MARLSKWTLLAVDVEGLTAVVEGPERQLRLLSVGDLLESFRVATVSKEKLALRPDRSAELEARKSIREVWLTPVSTRTGRRIVVVRSTEESNELVPTLVAREIRTSASKADPPPRTTAEGQDPP